MRKIQDPDLPQRIACIQREEDGARYMGEGMTIQASWGRGWEHVSVSRPSRDPSWEDMCRVKDMFFDDEDCVMQLHPPKSEYVNNHSHCLHLWYPIDGKIPRPEKILV